MALFHSVRIYITPRAWSWLNKRPSLPPPPLSRPSPLLYRLECAPTIRAHDDIELLTSDLDTMWSEWDCAGEWAFEGMRGALWEEYRGDGDKAREHRKDLLARLDLGLVELGKGLGHLGLRHPDMQPDEFEVIRGRSEEPKRILVQGTMPNTG